MNGPDARGDTYGGVPAIFKQFTLEAGLKDSDYEVSSELVGGAGFEHWFTPSAASALKKIQRPWDIVVMHGFSTLDQAHPGDPTLLLSSSKRIAQMFLKENPQAKLWLFANWGRADQTYPQGTHWYGKPIQQMGKDVQAAYEQVVKEEPRFAGVVPVGLAWNRAIDTGIADDNPYDDVGASKMDLWAYDHYHGSVFGYYLEALMDFGKITGLDPMVLSGKDKVAEDIGISPAQSKALMQVAHDTLAASN
ncbi:MAG TPA: PEP-CTERM sorting domain-containing protein [Verrucomicrobiae bacterium]|nr:PEP-CTERM sorting domain-containing protein [Verrucomicrobiae bacterium]